MQKSELDTRRLILRPLRLEGADQTQRLFPSWDVVKFLNAKIPWPYPPDGMRIIAREVRDFVSGRLLAEIWEINAEEWRQARNFVNI